jgi:hypothetical protein
MQTYLVHMRNPLQLYRELGARRFCGVQLTYGALVLSALAHPWFYVALAFKHHSPAAIADPAAGRRLDILSALAPNLLAGDIGRSLPRGVRPDSAALLLA